MISQHCKLCLVPHSSYSTQLCLQMHKHFHILSPPNPSQNPPSTFSSLSCLFTLTLMALSRNRHHHHLLLLLLLLLTFALVTAIFCTSLTPFSVEASSRDEEELRKMVLGSRPPACVNKCMSCRPCEATLVIPPHQSRMKRANLFHESSHREDDTYYLLSWKCRCGNKFYQP